MKSVRRRSTRLIEMTKNITESKVIDMVGARQAEGETKNEAVVNPLPMPLVLPATTKTRDVNVEPKISPPPIPKVLPLATESSASASASQLIQPQQQSPSPSVFDNHIKNTINILAFTTPSPPSTSLKSLGVLQSAVDVELSSLKEEYEQKYEELVSVNGLHELQLEILDRSIYAVSKNIQALNNAVNGDSKMLQKRNDELQADISFMQDKLKNAESWLDDILESKESQHSSSSSSFLTISSIISNIEKLRIERNQLLKRNTFQNKRK